MSLTSKNRIILSVVMLIILSIINYYVQFGDINGLLFIGVIIFFSYQDDVKFSGAILSGVDFSGIDLSGFEFSILIFLSSFE
jgi:uncharacterized protein YjbI with pentapeptide repeats